MYKAVVFDDEYIVIEGLKALIDWPSWGIELAGTATDGLSALETFRSVRPDIVFTDIRMPGMDGLALIEEIGRTAPETVCIVFSGFNEFEYVKRAIHLGVVDYLEKPISVEHVETAIRKALEHLKAAEEKVRLREEIRRNRNDIREKVTLDLLVSGAAAADKWRSAFPEEAERLTGITVFSHDGHYPLEEESGNERCAVPLRHGEEELLLVVHFAAPGREFWERAESLAEAATVGAGRTKGALEEAAASYREAQKALKTARFLQLSGLTRYDDIRDLITSPRSLSEREEDVLLSIRAGGKEDLMRRVGEYIDWMRNERLDPEMAEHELLKLVYLAQQSFKAMGQAEAADDAMPHVQIREASERGELFGWFRGRMERLAEQSIETRDKAKHTSIDKAKAYMEQHYDRDLSLSEVAEHVGMNAAYLSVLFKEAMGESYIKYLTRLRMERAKVLLSNGLKVQQVSERTGYHTYRHFSEVFKKYTGKTPGQYKEDREGSR